MSYPLSVGFAVHLMWFMPYKISDLCIYTYYLVLSKMIATQVRQKRCKEEDKAKGETGARPKKGSKMS